jgi:hypothetical protein
LLEIVHKAVEARFSPEGWKSTGVAFEDYERMRTVRRDHSGGRRNLCPDWAMNNDQLAKIITRSMEERALVHRGTVLKRALLGSSLEERYRFAEKKIHAMEPALLERLERLQHIYATLSEEPYFHPSVLDRLAQTIEEIDTNILANRKIGAVYAGITYHYHLRGADSVEVANILALKPPHIRQTIWRMDQVARDLGFEKRPLCCGSRYGYSRPRRSRTHGPCVVPQHLVSLIGTIVPKNCDDAYEKYAQFCGLVGANPMPEDVWGNRRKRC